MHDAQCTVQTVVRSEPDAQKIQCTTALRHSDVVPRMCHAFRQFVILYLLVHRALCIVHF